MNSIMALVYSYIRFSTKSQLEGDSLRRQLEDGEAWIARNKHTAAELTIQDLGVSAFRGKNKHRGALATFLEAAKAGHIPAGSILLVENLDRLSRQGIDEAQDLFKAILKAGVSIACLRPYEIVYTRDSLNDLIGMLMPLIYFHLAHVESLNKSKRIKANMDNKRAESLATGKPIDKMRPNWLDWKNDGFAENEGANAVRFIFKKTAEDIGTVRLVKLLQDQFPSIGRGRKGEAPAWNTSYISKILNDRSVLGERQHYEFDSEGNRKPIGEPVPNYYPRIITDELWYQTRSNRPGTRHSGRQSGMVNLFKGLIENAHDGHAMHLQRAKLPSGELQYRLVSYGHIRRLPSSDPVSVSYKRFERAFLDYLSEVKTSDLSPRNNTEIDLSERESELAGIRSRLKELVDLMAESPSKTSAQSAMKLEQREAFLVEEIEALRSQQQSREPILEVMSVIELLKDGDLSLRERLAAQLRRLVKKIWIKPEKHFGRVWAMAMIEFQNGTIRHVWISPGNQGGISEPQPNAEYLSIDLRDRGMVQSCRMIVGEKRPKPKLPDTIPENMAGAAEYWLLKIQEDLNEENYRMIPAKIRRFIVTVGDKPTLKIGSKDWAKWVASLQSGNRNTSRVSLNRTKEFCRWLISAGRMKDFPELNLSAAKQLP